MRLFYFVFLAALSTFSVSSAQAIEKCGKSKRITCVVDGDTIWLNGEKIRLMGFDTPETTTNICGGNRERKLGDQATMRLVELLSENNFSVDRDGKDKYGRTLAVIRVNNVNVGNLLVQEGLARYWPDGQEFWCD